MPNDAPLISWLDHLWQLYPAQGVLLVGAGNGASAWIEALQRWNAPNVMLVEADETQFQHLQRSVAATEGWQLRKQVVAQEAGSVTFHQASNPAESGLLEPEALRALWPNLKTRHKSTRQSITLAELLPMTTPGANWLLLDCLPAAPLLAGAGAALDGVDVILTRALLPNTALAAPCPQADAAAIAQALQAQGFCTVATQTGRHPGVVHTLHVRDRITQIEQLTTALAQASQHQQAQQQTHQAQMAAQAQAEHTAKQEATRLAAELAQSQKALQQARQTIEQAEQTAQTALSSLAEREAQTEALQRENAFVQQRLTQYTQAQATATQALQEREARLKNLQAELTQAQAAAQQATAQAEHSQQQLGKLQAEAAQWREAAEKAQAEATQTQAQAADAQAAAAKTLQEREARLKTLQAELAQAQAAAQQAAEQAEHSQQQLEKHQAEAAQWREAAETAQAQATQTQAQAADAQAAAAKTLQEREARLKNLQAELAQAKETAQQARDECAKSQQMLSALQTEVEQAQQAAQTANEHQATLQNLLTELQTIKASTQKPSQAPAALPEPLLASLQDIKAAVTGGFSGLQASLKAASAPAAPDNTELKQLIATQQTSLQGVAQQIAQIDLAGTLGPALEAQLAKQIAGGKESLKEVETRLRNDLNKGLANSVKQMEAFMRIQSFLGDGDSLGDFHGWPISPDIGLFLLDRMREQHYDLIIEFGSGTSTALFARAAEVLAQQAAAKATEGSANPEPPKTTIVSFEHDTLYHGKTLQMLKARGLQQHVRLVHAPLVDWREGDQTYLYYDCQATLAELAQQHANQQLRILLLVDGPPGATCPNARYPAVPFVFTALGRHQIDVVLDDASRPEEKQVIELWRAFWKQRSVRTTESLLQSEKGIFVATPM